MDNKNIIGKKAILYQSIKGTLIEGDGLVALADNSWFLIKSKATSGSALPFDEGYMFKTPDSSNAITPETGDDVWPLTFNQICKADVSMSASPETYTVPDDDCNASNGVMKTDYTGYIDYSGTVNGYLKMDEGGYSSDAQKEILLRFFEKQTDDGAGTYALTEKSEDSLIMATLQNKDNVAVTGVQEWLLGSVIFTALTFDKPLKDSQPFNGDFSAAGGPFTTYSRITNASETVLQ